MDQTGIEIHASICSFFMKTAILGAGAMGSVFASYLAESGDEVVLIDIAKPVVDAISSRGLISGTRRETRNLSG